MSRVLIVDDEPAICWALRECLSDEGLVVDVAGTAEQALELAGRQTPDVVMMDVRLPGMDGLHALQQLRSTFDDLPVIVMTAFGSLSTAVRAIDGGAFDYLIKPIDLNKAVAAVRQAIDSSQHATQEFSHGAGDETLIGSSMVMQEVFRQIALVAEHDVPVLITGESGTGKDLVARAIHQHSRRNGPLVPVCIPALSESVIESELFGHVRGAFTGADSERKGLLELADGGTAFVDEIGDVPLNLQAKLLRALELREIRPVGSSVGRTSQFRLIAATNQPLEKKVEERTFRADLFYRLNVFRIEVPPLRQRIDDIPALVQHFLRRNDPNDAALRISETAMDELKRRPWTGNVRELRNAMERAVVLCRGDVILPEHLPEASSPASIAEHNGIQELADSVTRWTQRMLSQDSTAESKALYEAFLAEAEPVLIDSVLAHTEGNRSLAAKILGIHRETMREKLRRHSG